MEDTVESARRRFQLGQAYLRLTANQAPSAQLLAFVTYDERESAEIIGLESLGDTTAIHAQLVEEIETEADEQGLESFEAEMAQEAQRFDAIMEERDLAIAYLAATESLGPCAQLIAFVNHDHTIQTNDGVALESLGLEEQHAFLVSKMNVDALDLMACESLGGRLKSGAARIKNAITFNKRGNDLTPFAKGKLILCDSNIYVPTHADFEKYAGVAKEMLPLLVWILDHMPRSHNVSDWEEWAKTNVQVGSQTEFAKKHEKIKALRSTLKSGKMLSKVDFKEAGWTADNFKAAIAELEAFVKKSIDHSVLADHITGDLAELIDKTSEPETAVTLNHERNNEGKIEKTGQSVTYKDRKDTHLAVRAMNSAFAALFDAWVLCDQTNKKMRKSLKDVSHHFHIVS